MIDPRYAELRQMLEVRRRDLQLNLGVKLRDLAANDGHDRELMGAVDAAEASDSDLNQDIAITLTEMTAEVLGRVDKRLHGSRAASMGFARTAQRRSLSSASRPSLLRCDVETVRNREISQRTREARRPDLA
jgi:hypothetical protein